MILVTGGGGFVGVNAARCLADKGEEVMLLQRRSRGVPPLLEQYWGKQVREATGSILELPFLFGLMKEFPIDGIVHAAFDSAGIDARGGGMSPSSGRTLYDVVQIGINTWKLIVKSGAAKQDDDDYLYVVVNAHNDQLPGIYQIKGILEQIPF